MPEIAAEQKGSRSPEVPADIVILFVLMKPSSSRMRERKFIDLLRKTKWSK